MVLFAVTPSPPEAELSDLLSSRSLCARALLLAAAGLLGLAHACGGGTSEDHDLFPRVVSLGQGDVFASVLNSSLTVGPNRMVLQLEDADEQAISGAQIHLRFFDLNGQEPQFAAEADARWIPVELAYVDESSVAKTREVAGDSGAYVANVNLPRSGDWGVRIAVSSDQETFDEFPFRFTVRERSDEPMIGDAAPPSEQATLATVAAIEDIDSSYPSRPAMHDTTIAAAIASGKPLVIAFATPAFCTTRTCAPVMDTVMDPLFDAYGDRAAFIHVEPYVLRDLRNGFSRNPVPAAREWQLQTEPWVFIVDRNGRVTAKFEGIVSVGEVEAALSATLAP